MVKTKDGTVMARLIAFIDDASRVLAPKLNYTQWNPLFLDFAGHYGFAPKTHYLYRPRTKGKVERAVHYLDGSFLRGHRVYFTTAIDVARKLAVALAENKLHRKMKNLTRPKLLIIDEVGFVFGFGGSLCLYIFILECHFCVSRKGVQSSP
jgi:hypothetical protein